MSRKRGAIFASQAAVTGTRLHATIQSIGLPSARRRSSRAFATARA